MGKDAAQGSQVVHALHHPESMEVVMPLRASHFALALATASTLASCTEPVAPVAALPDAVRGPNLASQTAVANRLRFDVTFNIPQATGGNRCGLPAPVTGSGVFQMVNRVSQTKSGEWRVHFSWSAHGTAVGDDGSQYRFNYVATGKWIDVVSPTTVPVEIELVDHFNLIGQGQTPDLKVFLKGRFLFDGVDVTPVGDPVIRGADVECDPI